VKNQVPPTTEPLVGIYDARRLRGPRQPRSGLKKQKKDSSSAKLRALWYMWP